MGTGIVFIFDAGLETKIKSIWAKFEVEGIGKTPGQFSEPPHVAIAGDLTVEDKVLIKMINDTSFSNTIVKFIPFGVFLGKEHVLYYNAILSEEIIKSYFDLYEGIAEKGIGYNKYYSPGNVLFHCTISVEIKDIDLQKAISIVRNNQEPFSGSIKGIELWHYFPVERIYRKEL